MPSTGRNARTHTASGRLPFSLLSGVLLALAGCTLAGPAAEAPAGATAPPPVVLEEGPIAPAREAEAAELFAQAWEAAGADRHTAAVELARRIVTEYPTAPVSGRALELLAREALAAGDPATAEAAATRYAGLLPADDSRKGAALVLQARARLALDDPRGAMEALLSVRRMPPGAVTEARRVARAASDLLEPDLLEELAGRVDPDGLAAPVLLVRTARARFFAGDREGARERASLALRLGAVGPDSVVAAQVLSGEVEPGPGDTPTLTIASVLPLSGSPALADFAALIQEGIEVAAATALEGEAHIVLDTRDDHGDPAVAASLIEELESRHVLGAVGFLDSGVLEAAAVNRTRGLPLISPTAVEVPADLRGVYSLAGPDPEAASAVARYAVRTGIVRVAVLHSRSSESAEEARAFMSTYRGLGGEVVGVFPYDAGATFFEEQVRGAAAALRAEEIAALGLSEEDTLHVELLDPVAVFVPAPPEDLEFLAPQITFFGLDTLGIQVLGTNGWSDPQVLETVNPRHTTGVVATAPVGTDASSRGYARFREAYENHFQRSLVSPVPSLGYDAALLLLETVRLGARSPREAAAALQRVRDLEGATGTLSVLGGRVLRRTEVVRIDHGTPIPIG